MATVRTAEGAELHWELRGEGPLVALALSPMTYPAVYEPIIADLAADHAVVTWDPRGTGSSSKAGPYEIETDARDLAVVIEAGMARDEVTGEDALVFAIPYGINVALALASERPELVFGVVSSGSIPVVRQRFAAGDSLSGSESLTEMLLTQARTDWRGLLWSMITTANPQLDEAGVRERVNGTAEYLPQEVAIARGESWLADAEAEAEARARALGDRLVLATGGENPWLPTDALEIARSVLPEAVLEQTDGGPVSRPDLAAALVRRTTVRVLR